MDEIGYIVFAACKLHFEGESAHLAPASVQSPLVGEFAPSYGMVMNLAPKYRLIQAEIW
jgi:superfamily II RNA helicase